MSLTNDMVRLKAIADNIALDQEREMKAPKSIVETMEGSYHEKRTRTSNEPESVLKEYGFETLVDLKHLLEIMWKEMGKEEMLNFIPVSMAASGKNEPKDGKSKLAHNVSSFVYEF